jgi:hypothetical protein
MTHDTDPNWYLDSRASDHITSELDKLTMHDHYHDDDQVRTTNGAGMHINRIGNSVIPTPHRNLHLTNVLQIPWTHKHLISIHHFNLDSHTFIELHPHFSLSRIKPRRQSCCTGHVRARSTLFHHPSCPLSRSLCLLQ